MPPPSSVMLWHMNGCSITLYHYYELLVPDLVLDVRNQLWAISRTCTQKPRLWGIKFHHFISGMLRIKEIPHKLELGIKNPESVKNINHTIWAWCVMKELTNVYIQMTKNNLYHKFLFQNIIWLVLKTVENRSEQEWGKIWAFIITTTTLSSKLNLQNFSSDGQPSSLAHDNKNTFEYYILLFTWQKCLHLQ